MLQAAAYLVWVLSLLCEKCFYSHRWRSPLHLGRTTDASVDQEGFPSCSRQRVLITGVQRFSVILTDILWWCTRTDDQYTDGLTPWSGPLASCCFRRHLVSTEAGTCLLNKDLCAFQPVFAVFGCGTPAVKPDTSRVVNGEDARPHSWPWQVLESQCSGRVSLSRLLLWPVTRFHRSPCRWNTAAGTITRVEGPWSDLAGCWPPATASGNRQQKMKLSVCF